MGIALAGMLLLLVLMVRVAVSAADSYERVLGLAGPGTITVQATPTEDATVAALNKEKLATASGPKLCASSVAAQLNGKALGTFRASNSCLEDLSSERTHLKTSCYKEIRA